MVEASLQGVETTEALAESSRWLTSLKDKAGGVMRKAMAASGIVFASGALAPAAFANYQPYGGYIGGTDEHNLAVVLVNFENSSDPPLNAEQIDQMMFTGPDSVSSYYSTASFGKLDLHGEVVSSVELPDTLGPSCNGADFLKIGAAANAAIKKSSGTNLAGYDNYVYVLSQQADCINTNNQQVLNGQTIGNVSFINRPSNAQMEGVDVHELGHQFGLSHANVVHCYKPNGRQVQTPVNLSGDCTRVIYQDPFDPMGTARLSTGAPIDFDALNKARLGWLKPQNIKTVTRSETITIAPDELPSDEPQLVRIPYGHRGGEERYLYIDYRQPLGEDAKVASTEKLATMFRGITLREAGPIGRGQPITTLTDYSNLIDTNPETATALDAPLGASHMYHDAKTGIAVRTVELSPSSAKVSITIPSH